jgi:predicted phosphodiesterase
MSATHPTRLNTPKMINSVTIIGDCHQKYRRYHEIIRQKDRHEYTIQIGDFGLSKYETLDNVDHTKHIIIRGNHDNTILAKNYPHFLDAYGYMTNFNGINFFWYSGAYSIDRQYRTIGIDYFEDEQLSIDQFMKARELYREIKPDIVLTHDCPDFMVPEYIGPYAKRYENITGWALGELYKIHQPKLFIHGHYHVSKTTQYGDTKFVCLNELETYLLTV